MSKSSSLTMLQSLADDKLQQTALELGKVQQEHQKAINKLECLSGFQREYRQNMQQHIVEKGMRVMDIHLYQSFLNDLNQVVSIQTQQVEQCEGTVESVTKVWCEDKRRLNAFTALNERANTLFRLDENRREQKLMDDFAQRALRGKDDYVYKSGY